MMLLASVQYRKPASVREATEMLAQDPSARPLAGGQTLINVLKLRLAAPSALIDISGLSELRQVATTADGGLRVGACVTYDEIAHSSRVREQHPAIARMAGRLVDRQVRSRGTIGGNICLADPTSNFPPLAVALEARFIVEGPTGTRDIPAAEFFRGPYLIELRRGEILRDVIFTRMAANERVGYESLLVGADSWALARAVAWVRYTRTIESARVVLGCVPVPGRQRGFERALVGMTPDRRRVAEAAELHVAEDFEPPDDVHASADYRRQMTRVVATRAVIAATVGA